jgi:hypothetical protein
MDTEELRICRPSGHRWTWGEGWNQCKWCGLSLREKREIEERERDHQADETASPKRRNSQTGEDTPLSTAELAICRRRGHSIWAGKEWSKCSFCGYWIRENLTRKEREDEPPIDEMSLGTQNDHALDQLERSKEGADEQWQDRAATNPLSKGPAQRIIAVLRGMTCMA